MQFDWRWLQLASARELAAAAVVAAGVAVVDTSLAVVGEPDQTTWMDQLIQYFPNE